MPHARYIPWSILVCGCCLVLLGCGKPRVVKPSSPSAPAAPPKPTAAGVIVSGENYRIVFPEAGPRVWVAEAKEIKADAGSGMLTLTGVTCQLYQQGREVLRVTAARGTAALQGKTARVSLTGNVHAQQPARKLRLAAEQFRWTSNTDTITASAVRWQGMGFEHRADAGTFTTDLTKATFTGHVETSGVLGVK